MDKGRKSKGAGVRRNGHSAVLMKVRTASSKSDIGATTSLPPKMVNYLLGVSLSNTVQTLKNRIKCIFKENDSVCVLVFIYTNSTLHSKFTVISCLTYI